MPVKLSPVMKNLVIMVFGGAIMILITLLVHFSSINSENEEIFEDFKTRVKQLENKITFLETLIEPGSYELEEDICIGRDVDQNCKR